MSRKYVAKYDGKIVGKRTTKERVYTHAIVTQESAEFARAEAYGWKPGETEKINFVYACAVASCEGKHMDQIPGYAASYSVGAVESRDGMRRPIFLSQSADEVAKAKAQVEGGFEGYTARILASRIASFERRLAADGFAPVVAAWCGRLDLAQREAARHNVGPRLCLVEIVPAEEI